VGSPLGACSGAPGRATCAQMTPQDVPASAYEIADELVAESRRVLGANLVAAILHGSLASDDFVANRSDIDLLVIVLRSLSEERKRVLKDTVIPLAQRRHVRIDYRVVTAETAQQRQRMPMVDLAVGMHPGLPKGVEVEDGPAPEPDLWFEFSICREAGRSLAGPAPSNLIGPVPNGWLLDVGDTYLKIWQEIEYDDKVAELMVFTACRLWYRSVEARHCSKSDAARWVMRQAPDLIAPKQALERRTTNAEPSIPQAEVMALLARVRRVLADRA
jgi:hypothetical protein